MPRKRVRKTSRGESDILWYKNAYDEVKLGTSLRKAAEKYGINYVSLLRYKRKRDAVNEDDYEQAENVSMGYVAHNKVFNENQTQILLVGYVQLLLRDCFRLVSLIKYRKNIIFVDLF